MLVFYIFKDDGPRRRDWARERSRQQLRLEANTFLRMRDKDSLVCGPGHPSWCAVQLRLRLQPSWVLAFHSAAFFHWLPAGGLPCRLADYLTSFSCSGL